MVIWQNIEMANLISLLSSHILNLLHPVVKYHETPSTTLNISLYPSPFPSLTPSLQLSLTPPVFISCFLYISLSIPLSLTPHCVSLTPTTLLALPLHSTHTCFTPSLYLSAFHPCLSLSIQLSLSLSLSINLCYFILSALAPYILLPLPLFIYLLSLSISLYPSFAFIIAVSSSPSPCLFFLLFSVHLHTHEHTSNYFILEKIILTSLRLAGRELVNTIAWLTSVQKKYE